MASAVYLIHYKHPRNHHRHAVRTITAPASILRNLHRHLDPLAIDAKANALGIGFVLVRTWIGKDERFGHRLKRQKHHSRLCPVCNPQSYACRTKRMKDWAGRGSSSN